MNNKDNRVFMSRNYRRVAPWKFDVFKTSIFALEASRSLGQIFVLRTSNFKFKFFKNFKFPKGNYQPIVARQKHNTVHVYNLIGPCACCGHIT